MEAKIYGRWNRGVGDTRNLHYFGANLVFFYKGHHLQNLSVPAFEYRGRFVFIITSLHGYPENTRQSTFH